MHGGAAVGLGQDEQLVLAGLGAGVGGQPAERRGVGVPGWVLSLCGCCGSERRMPSPVPGTATSTSSGCRPRGLGGQLVLAVAEEGEVVVGEPAQQLAGLADLLRRAAAAAAAASSSAMRSAACAHLRPVLDGLADVGEHPAQVGGDLLEVGRGRSRGRSRRGSRTRRARRAAASPSPCRRRRGGQDLDAACR